MNINYIYNYNFINIIFYMNHINFFKDSEESIPECRKIAIVMFLFKNDFDFLKECGFLKNDISSLNKEFKIILMEENEEYLSCIKNEEKSITERILNK